MADRKKIIKALTECIFLHEHPDDDAGCFECPYRPDEKGTCPTMIPFLKDVLELLKEHENEKAEYIWECPKCSSQLILKTSKTSKAIGMDLSVCPVCGKKVLYGKAD